MGSHIELGGHLLYLAERAKNQEISIQYDVHSYPNNTLPQKKPQPLSIASHQTNGYQMSMFQTPGNQDGFNDQWDCTWQMNNTANGASIMFGATCFPPYRGQIE